MQSPSLRDALRRRLGVVLHELRTALRTSRRAAGSSSVAILTLAVAIGSTTAVYSTLEHVVLNPLPYEDSDRLVVLWRKAEQIDDSLMVNPSRQLLDHWRDHARTLSAIEGVATLELTHDDGESAESWTGLRASADYLRFLGRSPARGRMFTSDETSERPLLLSFARWRRDFGGTDEVIGRALRLDGEVHTVIGVLPPHFPLPIGSPAPVDALLPLSGDEESLHAIGRLSAGTDLEDARRELDQLLRSIELDGEYAWRAAVLRPTELLGSLPETLWTLMASVAVVLLVACTNVGGLLLGRHARRRRELALRAALGASRLRVALQLFLESSWLALAAGGLGVALAIGIVEVLRKLRPEGMEALELARISPRALLFASALSFAAAALAGLAPALRGARRFDPGDLRAGLGATADRAQRRLRASLVVAQVALSFLLTVAGSLLAQNVRDLRSLDLGFDADRLATALVRLPEHSFSSEAARKTYWEQALATAARLPGVEAACLASGVPPDSSITVGRLEVEDREPGEDAPTFFWWNHVDAEYPRVAGVRVVDGDVAAASFAPRSAAGAGREEGSDLLVNEAFARRIWGSTEIAGERLRLGEGPWRRVAAVVADVRVAGPGSALEAPQLYAPFARDLDRAFVVVRTAGDPAVAVPALREAVTGIDPRALVERVGTVDSALWRSLAEERFTLSLLAAFAAGALFLAVVGLYSVVAQGVDESRRELALRLALGASETALRARVVAGGALLAGLGMGAGLALSVVFARLASSPVFGETEPGPGLYVIASLLVASAVATAMIGPARVAGSIEPIRYLRQE